MGIFTRLNIIVLIVVAIIHVLRVALGWEVSIGGMIVPMWASLVACIASAAIAIMVWKENRK